MQLTHVPAVSAVCSIVTAVCSIVAAVFTTPGVQYEQYGPPLGMICDTENTSLSYPGLDWTRSVSLILRISWILKIKLDIDYITIHGYLT